MIRYYFCYILALSLITFLLYGTDKRRAVHGKWRISEKALLLSSLLGGAVGGFLAMQIFRHKTKHWYFTAVNLFAIFLHVTLLFLLYTKT